MGRGLAGAARALLELESLEPGGTRGPLDYLFVALTAGARFDQLPGGVALLARVKAGRLSFEQLLQQIGLHLEDRE